MRVAAAGRTMRVPGPDPMPVTPIDATGPRNDSRSVQLQDGAGSPRRKPRRARAGLRDLKKCSVVGRGSVRAGEGAPTRLSLSSLALVSNPGLLTGTDNSAAISRTPATSLKLEPG